jgi:hypothetical protein
MEIETRNRRNLKREEEVEKEQELNEQAHKSQMQGL